MKHLHLFIFFVQKINFGESYSSIFTKNEVVDGQQRSTTLYLLLKYLYFKEDKLLSFSSIGYNY